MDYQIVTGYGAGELALKVNELMDLGWSPAGGVAVEPASNGFVAIYAQAMVSTQQSREAATLAEIRCLEGMPPNFCESCAMDLSTCDCATPRPTWVRLVPERENVSGSGAERASESDSRHSADGDTYTTAPTIIQQARDGLARWEAQRSS